MAVPPALLFLCDDSEALTLVDHTSHHYRQSYHHSLPLQASCEDHTINSTPAEQPATADSGPPAEEDRETQQQATAGADCGASLLRMSMGPRLDRSHVGHPKRTQLRAAEDLFEVRSLRPQSEVLNANETKEMGRGADLSSESPVSIQSVEMEAVQSYRYFGIYRIKMGRHPTICFRSWVK
ncbi:unnamed protein product [Pleuronectes platessa]|uniref:Uncharacterized protein n=1 Tax=Pleuronectes platessa TaxID=8262 RepID=A0A9N7VH20_PLEPL|nr:unnamed protein product [Pleuronectes platessa]